MFSATWSARSLIGNGGASAALSTSTVQSCSSMPPVGSLSLTFSGGRRATVPVTRTTYSGADVDGVVDDRLGEAGVVADVDEGQLLAVLAARGHPAAEDHLAADVVRPEITALVGAHRGDGSGSGLAVVGGGAHRSAFVR